MSQIQLKTYEIGILKEVKVLLAKKPYKHIQLWYDTQEEKFVVEKRCLRDGSKEDATRITAARREAEILAGLKHKNIIRILGIHKNDNFATVLEYAPYGNLKDYLIDETNQLPWETRLRFFKELATALHYLHNQFGENFYVHGNVKPSNVLLAEKLQIKLADFKATTFAMYSDDLTQHPLNREEKTHFTPIYAAPEYLKDPSKEKESTMDVYSYGMVGYEILTRKTVFSDLELPKDTVVEFIKRTGRKPSLELIHKTAGAEVKSASETEIFSKLTVQVYECLEQKPSDRPDISDVMQCL